MSSLMTYVDTFGGGVVVGLIGPYILKNYGGALLGTLWSDVKKLWSKVTPAPAPVAAPAPSA